MELTVNNEFGLVLATLAADFVVHHIWMPLNVIKARKKYDVKLPALYADKDSKDAKTFNCIQRAHQNSLENQPAFLALLLVAGVKYPVSASVAGAVYLLGRIVYFKGYSTGNPDGRRRGGFAHLGELALLTMVGRWAVELVSPLVSKLF